MHALARQSCCCNDELHSLASNAGSCACERFGCMGAFASAAAHAAALARCAVDAALGPRRRCPDGAFDRWVLSSTKFEVQRQRPCTCSSGIKSTTSLEEAIGRASIEASGWDSRGLFFYPPGGCREWHTNERDPSGWRLYVSYTKGTSHFHFVDDSINTVVSQKEQSGALVRMFRVSDGVTEGMPPVLWHAISAAPDGSKRWSVGFRLRDEQARTILRRVNTDVHVVNPVQQSMQRDALIS